MSKRDWLEVGLRLMGAYWAVQGVLTLTGAASLFVRSGGQVTPFSFEHAAVTVVLGGALFLYAPRIVSWASRRAGDSGP